MKENNFLDMLRKIVGDSRLFFDESMKEHTTFRVGGPAQYFVSPDSEEKICQIYSLCKEYAIPCTILGNGSNLLVGDKGIDGVVLYIGKDFSDITIEGKEIYARAGALLVKVASEAAKESLTGLEFASGIPGTIGGAAVMNAGAYGGEIKDVVAYVRALTPKGEIIDIPSDELQFGYRSSILQKEGYIVLGVKFMLEKGDPDQIYARMNELKDARKEKQPIEFPSAGSTFKRPEGYFAGKLIMDAGLKGYCVGDAQVAVKHCGFVINKGEASAKDIMNLIEHVQKTVLDQFGVMLEMEVKRVGIF